MQPNFYSVQDVTSFERLSIYNLTVKMHNPTEWDQTSVEFSDVIFDTHRGELDETGITPPLFELQRITARNESKLDTKVICNVLKPIQIKLTPTSVTNLFNFKDTINRMLRTTNPISKQCTERPILRLNNIREIRKLIGGPSLIEFNMTKISINFMTSLDRVVSLALFKWTNKIEVRERLKQIFYTTNIETISMNTQNSMLLHPTTVAFECVLSQEKWSKRLVISTSFTSNSIHLQINPTDFWTFAKVQLDFWSCINGCFVAATSTDDERNANELANETVHRPNLDNGILYELPRIKRSNSRASEEYFQDDLRFVPNELLEHTIHLLAKESLLF